MCYGEERSLVGRISGKNGYPELCAVSTDLWGGIGGAGLFTIEDIIWCVGHYAWALEPLLYSVINGNLLQRWGLPAE